MKKVAGKSVVSGHGAGHCAIVSLTVMALSLSLCLGLAAVIPDVGGDGGGLPAWAMVDPNVELVEFSAADRAAALAAGPLDWREKGAVRGTSTPALPNPTHPPPGASDTIAELVSQLSVPGVLLGLTFLARATATASLSRTYR